MLFSSTIKRECLRLTSEAIISSSVQYEHEKKAHKLAKEVDVPVACVHDLFRAVLGHALHEKGLQRHKYVESTGRQPWTKRLLVPRRNRR